MDVQFEILQGRLRQGNAAAVVKSFKITMRRFIIGSEASCHLVCKSRTISGRHCVILIEHGNVLVRDLDSEAGTFVNDVPVVGTQLISEGDKLRVGRLEFRLAITGSSSLTPPARPATTPTPEMPEVPETPTDGTSVDTVVGAETVDTLVTELLQQEDEAAREARYADPAARYFRADQVPRTESAESVPDQPPPKQRPIKKSVGKLPAPPPIKANDSVSAAEQALQELFQPNKGTRKR